MAKKNLGSRPQPKPFSDARAKMAGQTIESLERLGAIAVTQNAHEHFRGPEVTSHFDAGDGDHAGDARILHVLVEEARYFLANRFSEAVGTSVLSHLVSGSGVWRVECDRFPHATPTFIRQLRRRGSGRIPQCGSTR